MTNDWIRNVRVGIQVSLQVQGVTKSFGDKTAVQNLSFTVEKGMVFGLLGLNGAGKSTTIRMILDIMQPDVGQIHWKGQMTSQAKFRFGYLPEERGLYQQMKVFAHLVLFGRLSGMHRVDAEGAAKTWLERFEIDIYANNTVNELSKGNQQKVQFIGAILHNPELLILDEPFSGLDPVNTSLFKDVFRELATSGKTILFSSHRLDHVEELSDAVGIIHASQLVESGRVEEILAMQTPKTLKVGAEPQKVQSYLPEGCPMELHRGYVQIPMQYCNPAQLLHDLVTHGVTVTHFEYVRPSLNDVFLEKVGRGA
jgi:ABC-2 type transport system ATP-binding protein